MCVTFTKDERKELCSHFPSPDQFIFEGAAAEKKERSTHLSVIENREFERSIVEYRWVGRKVCPWLVRLLSLDESILAQSEREQIFCAPGVHGHKNRNCGRKRIPVFLRSLFSHSWDLAYLSDIANKRTDKMGKREKTENGRGICYGSAGGQRGSRKTRQDGGIRENNWLGMRWRQKDSIAKGKTSTSVGWKCY